MDRIRVGIVGAGFGGYGLLPAFRRDNRCEVTALATSSEDNARRAAATLGINRSFACWEDLVNSKEVDAVAIATPPVFQPAIALAAISMGKPVFAEKPMAATLADAEALLKAVEESQLANVIDFIFPELVVFQKAKELIGRGDIGTPLHIAAEWIFWSADHRSDATTWRTDVQAGGGALSHYGSHMIYYIQWLLGPIISLAARVTKPAGYQHSGDTVATLVLSFANGAAGTLTVSSGSPTAAKHAVEILGTDGTVVLSNDSENAVHGFKLQHHQRTGSTWTIVEPEETGVDCRVPAASRIVHRFMDWILTVQETRPSFRDGLDVQKVIEFGDSIESNTVKNIRIVGDGTVMGTRIFDSDGKDITADLKVRKLTITHEASGIPIAVLECLQPEIDVTILDDVAITRVPQR